MSARGQRKDKNMPSVIYNILKSAAEHALAEDRRADAEQAIKLLEQFDHDCDAEATKALRGRLTALGGSGGGPHNPPPGPGGG